MATERLRTIKPSGQGGDYTSLSGWEAGEQGDLVTADLYVIGEISGTWSGADTGQVTIDGWTTDATRYIEVRAVGSSLHAGKWDSTKYVLAPSTGQTACMTVVASYVKIIGLQSEVSQAGTSPDWAICFHTDYSAAPVNVVFERCIARATGTLGTPDYSAGFWMNQPTSTKAINCVAYGFDSTSTTSGGFYNDRGITYNCTAYDCARGFYGGNVSAIAKNCLAQSCTDGFAGSWDTTTSTTNCSDIASDAPGTSPVTGTATFVDAANGDFHLASGDTVAKNAGTDLSGDGTYPFSNDIDGATRIGTWDIGADEITGSAPLPLRAARNYNHQHLLVR